MYLFHLIEFFFSTLLITVGGKKCKGAIANICTCTQSVVSDINVYLKANLWAYFLCF